jgi:hypothetical protein
MMNAMPGMTRVSGFKKGLLTMAFLTFSCCLCGQEYFDLAKISYATTPNNRFDDGQAGSTIEELGLQINLPIVLNEKSVLIAGLTGYRVATGIDPSINGKTRLFAAGVSVGLNQTYSDTWSATYMVLPKFSSDFSNSLATGFQLGLLTLINKKRSARFKYTFGVYTNTEQYGLLIVPLLGGYYQSADERFEANVLLPAAVDLNYLLGTKLRVGMNFDGLGSTYALDNQIYGSSYVQKSSNELFAYTRYPLTKSLLLHLRMGYAFFRSYKVYGTDDKIDFSISSIYFGDNRTLLNTPFKDGMIFKVDFVYRLYFDQVSK